MYAKIDMPSSIEAEHAAIHEALVQAVGMAGRVGEAARFLAQVQHEHFTREEEIALPPLALLAPLARGEFDPAMASVLAMTDALRAELPRMLAQHKAIAAATRKLKAAAQAEGNESAERLADRILVHYRGEEEILYPAALLVGELVRAHQVAPAAG